MKRKVLNSMTQFTFKLYDALCDTIDKDDNVIFSPASIYAALSMTYCGARGNTADEMMKAMGIPGNADFHETFSKIWNGIYKAHTNSECDLNMANRLWLQKGFTVEKEFSDALAKYYNGDVGDVDFLSNPKSATQAINKWVEEKTNKLIKNVVEEGSISSDTKLIITNTLYFRGEWLHPFLSCDTKEVPFHTDVRNSCNVNMMYQKKCFGYTRDKNYDCQVLVARYESASLRMLVILPNKIDGLADLEKQLKTQGLEDYIFDNWISPGNLQVEVYIPRFKFSQKYDLIKSLQAIGITNLFTMSSNLSGISSEAVYVSTIVHEAFIAVNEEGTEACAYTGTSIRSAGISDPPIFKADHPFLFLIIDNDTSCVLFWGRFCKPC